MESMADHLLKRPRSPGRPGSKSITQPSKQSVFSEHIREYMTQKLREEFPFLEQQALEELAFQWNQTFAARLTLEAPRMEASHARVNLLTIPAEVRTNIFMLVLKIHMEDDGAARCPDGTAAIDLQDWTDYFNTGHNLWIKQPTLSKACRQLRSEALPISYGGNTFVSHRSLDRGHVGR